MKTFLKILFISLAVIFVIILTIPLFFKGEIMKLAKEEVNKNVRATVDWEDISISLFRGFPDLEVSLEKLSVTGIDQFKGDTLVAFDNLSFDVDLISAFSGTVEVKSIILDEPVVRAIALEDSSVNWDITYPSEEEVKTEPEDSSSMNLTISLREFLINKGNISYYDEALDMYAVIDQFNLDLSGNFSEEYTDMNLKSSTEALTVEYEGVKYLNKAKLLISAILGADLANSKYTIRDNEIQLNDIILGMDGFVSMPNEEDIVVDINYFTKETDFKSLLSLIPAIYMKDFEGLEASGSLSLKGDARGTINENVLPVVNLSLDVNDGRFHYPDLPASADNIQMDLKVLYDGVTGDNTRIDLNRFHVELADNPVDMTLHILTPETDMQMNGSLAGHIDLAALSDVVPVEDMDMSGMITADLEVMGRYSDIENENYEAFNANGSLKVSNIQVSGEDIPVPVVIEESNMKFTSRYIELSSFNAKMGESDLRMSGQLENFIPYVLRDQTIKGTLEVNSNLLNLNELTSGLPEDEAEVPEDTAALSVIEVPKNIDFKLLAAVDKLIYDNLTIDNLKGSLLVHDGMVRMDELSMNLLEGTMIISGEYNTQDISTPLVDLDLALNNIDISSSFHAFNTVEKLAPVAESTRGKVSVNFAFTSFLDSTMNPVLNSIIGKGKLETDEIQIVNNNTMDKMANMLKADFLKDPSFRDVNLSFEMRDGRVYVDPFDTQLASAEVTISGSQGIDQTMDYNLDFSIPRNEFGSTANDVLENLASQARSKGFDIQPGENVNVALSLTGSFSDPEISMNFEEGVKNIKEDVKEAVKDRVQEEVEKVKEDVRKDVSAEVDKIMKNAEEEAAKIKRTAKEAGDALIGEAELRRKQLIKEAGSNPFKKLAAEKTGDELVNNAEKQAQNLMEEAEKKAEAVMETARQKAEELKAR